MRLAWITDVHLDFLSSAGISAFIAQIAQQNPDALLITGDIGEAHTFEAYLIQIADTLKIPIYFVLGNHDYYQSSIADVRNKAKNLHDKHDYLYWLPLSGAIVLGQDAYLVGHGGWSDGGYGDFMQSSVTLSDYVLINDFKALPQAILLEKLTALGQEAGDYLRQTLTPLMPQGKTIIVALHSPPFQESTWHEGNTPDDDNPYLPHFSCKGVGDVIKDLAQHYPDTAIQVLCGHTHGYGESQILPNLHVITGGATYEKPIVQQVFSFK